MSAHMFAHPIKYLYIFKYLEKQKVKDYLPWYNTIFFIWIKVRLHYSQIYFRMVWKMYLIKECDK